MKNKHNSLNSNFPDKSFVSLVYLLLVVIVSLGHLHEFNWTVKVYKKHLYVL